MSSTTVREWFADEVSEQSETPSRCGHSASSATGITSVFCNGNGCDPLAMTTQSMKMSRHALIKERPSSGKE